MSATETPREPTLRSRLFAVPKRVFWGTVEDDCLGLSAQIAYYGLLSLFPFLLFLRALVPHLPGKGEVIERTLHGLELMVTPESRLYEIVRDNIVDQLDAGSSTLLSVGVLLTLWGGSSSFAVLIKAINRAYAIRETRSWQRRRLLAVAMTLMTALFIPMGVTLVLLGPSFGETLGRLVGAEWAVHAVWRAVRWPAVVAFLTIGLAVIYYFAPNTPQRAMHVLPGSFFAVIAIIGSSLGFSWFIGLNLFELKWFTYGAIGTVIVILFWMYLMGLAVLIGAELNDAVGRALGRPPREGAQVEKEAPSLDPAVERPA